METPEQSSRKQIPIFNWGLGLYIFFVVMSVIGMWRDYSTIPAPYQSAYFISDFFSIAGILDNFIFYSLGPAVNGAFLIYFYRRNARKIDSKFKRSLLGCLVVITGYITFLLSVFLLGVVI